jgi:hypothetical protein
VDRFQILKGLTPPPPKKIKSQHCYYYGVDWGPRPENTAIAICHKEGKICVFDYANLMACTIHSNLRNCLAFFNDMFLIKRLTVDVGPNREDLIGISYNQVQCTEDLILFFSHAVSDGRIHGLEKTQWQIRQNSHVGDAMALAFWSIRNYEPPVQGD